MAVWKSYYHGGSVLINCKLTVKIHAYLHKTKNSLGSWWTLFFQFWIMSMLISPWCTSEKLFSNKTPDSSNVSLIAHILKATSLGMSVVDFFSTGGRGPCILTRVVKSVPNLANDCLNSSIQSFEKSACFSIKPPGNTYILGWFWKLKQEKAVNRAIESGNFQSCRLNRCTMSFTYHKSTLVSSFK